MAAIQPQRVETFLESREMRQMFASVYFPIQRTCHMSSLMTYSLLDGVFTLICQGLYKPECDILVPGILLLFGWYQYGKNLVKKKYSNQYQKNLVPEKVPVSVPEQFGTGTGKFPGIFLFLGGTDIGTGTNWSKKKYWYR